MQLSVDTADEDEDKDDDDDDDDDAASVGAIRMFNPYTWTVPVQHTSIVDDNRNLTKSFRASNDDDDDE